MFYLSMSVISSGALKESCMLFGSVERGIGLKTYNIKRKNQISRAGNDITCGLLLGITLFLLLFSMTLVIPTER